MLLRPTPSPPPSLLGAAGATGSAVATAVSSTGWLAGCVGRGSGCTTNGGWVCRGVVATSVVRTMRRVHQHQTATSSTQRPRHTPASPLTPAAGRGLGAGGAMSPPRLQLVTPPGGASTREEGRSVMKLLRQVGARVSVSKQLGSGRPLQLKLAGAGSCCCTKGISSPSTEAAAARHPHFNVPVPPAAQPSTPTCVRKAGSV